MPTWVPIGTATAGASTSTVEFNSFSGYTDLVLITAAAPSGSGQSIYARFNSSTGSYAWIQMYVSGSTLASNSGAGGFTKLLNNCDSNVGFFGANWVWIPNYNNNTSWKQTLARTGGTTNGTMWSNSAWQGGAITSITLTDESGGNFRQGSTFTLFGILAA
jgi:hypothetical protein